MKAKAGAAFTTGLAYAKWGAGKIKAKADETGVTEKANQVGAAAYAKASQVGSNVQANLQNQAKEKAKQDAQENAKHASKRAEELAIHAMNRTK